ncbi:DUF4157 domain-containing protein [Streptomyces sp. NPDC090106]|uniref:eCIS core domain-containing protein n=1 Tax=Streptomyces sp. NPDC090106 TaxID=3365946 RepID=UPI0038118517
MQTSRPHGERAETGAPRAARGESAARRTPSAGAAVPPPLTADVLRAAQSGAGNAAVSGMIARRMRPSPGPQQQDTGVRQVLGSAGKPLAGPVRKEMESRFDTDFSGVRLHTGAAASRSAQAIGARAYTSGSHVVLGAGGGDKHTLAHELTHVVQQRQGPVSGTDHGNGLRISDPSDRFEREAESNARRVMSGPVPVARAVDGPGHGHEHGGGAPCSGGTDAVQRLVGFEVELSVPSFESHAPDGLNPVGGRQPSPELGGFFHGGFPYAATVMSEENLTILTDHNSLARRVRVLHSLLSKLPNGTGDMAVTGQIASSMSNLEYVTTPFDEMAAGSDAAVKKVADRIDEHVNAIFAQNPRANSFRVPGSPVAWTGTPMDALQAWLGPELWGHPNIQTAVKAFQEDIKAEMYVQATLGVLPSGLPSLYNFQATDVNHDSRRVKGKEHIADGWRDAAAAINRSVPTLRSDVVPRLMPGLDNGDQAALTGTLALGLSYAIGSAMIEAGVRGPTSTTKNAVPFLLKLANLGGIRSMATTDKLREQLVGQDVLGHLAAWMHGHIPETGVAHWEKLLDKYPDNTPNPTDPAYGTGATGAANTAQMLESLLNGTDFPVVAPGKALPRADEPNAAIVPYIGGQKGAPVEMRWLTTRATEPGQLWRMFKTIMDEARKANLATVPSDQSAAIWAAATSTSAAPAAASSSTTQQAEMMDMD